MRVDELRTQLASLPERGDPELLREMIEKLREAADGRLVDSMHGDYTAYYEKRPIRPTLPNDTQTVFLLPLEPGSVESTNPYPTYRTGVPSRQSREVVLNFMGGIGAGSASTSKATS